MLRSVLLGLTTFFFIFGWKACPLADLILLVSLGLIVASLIKGQLFADPVIIRVITWLGLLSIYATAVVLLNGLLDTQIAMRSLRALINFLGSLALVNLYQHHAGKEFSSRLLRDIYLALVGHAALMIAMFKNETLRKTIYQLTDANAYVNLGTSFLDGYRITGLTYGLSQTSVLQMLGLLLLPAVMRNTPRTIGRLLLLAGAPLLIISILISGRSGLLMGLIMVPICLFTLLWPDDKPLRPSMVLVTSLKLLLAIVLIAALTLCITFKLPERFYAYSLSQAGEITEGATLQGPTVDVMADMYFLPTRNWELLFGSSNLGRGSLENIPSDVGWVKTIFAIGLTGTLLMLAPYLIAIRVALQTRHHDFYLAAAATMVFCSAIALNTKELALLTRNQWSVHSLLLVTLCLMQQRKGATTGHA
ncbi:MAG TPA: hypothetical protein PLM07_02220 [Candidatus Rifleibacterium sp.]|nr:hypothetical protein [Candidatus Rifleibacterium sp.]HPT44697.1 hypothetical protein [Candidatus Rifleibacterium sp.]